MRFAKEAGIGDLQGVETCISRSDDVPQIERDLMAAEELDLFGTPSTIINGVLWSIVPEASDIEDVLSEVRALRNVSGGPP